MTAQLGHERSGGPSSTVGLGVALIAAAALAVPLVSFAVQETRGDECLVEVVVGGRVVVVVVVVVGGSVVVVVVVGGRVLVVVVGEPTGGVTVRP